MATAQFTVEQAIRRVRMKIRNHAGNVERGDIIEAVDDAQQELWRRLVLEDRGWFTKVSTTVTALTVALNYLLDEDFHQLYFLEVTTAGKQNLKFSYAAMNSDTFQDRRRETAVPATTETAFYYDVIGDNPSSLELAGGIPASFDPLAVQIYYVRRIDKVTSEADALDTALAPFLGPLTSRAAAQIAAGVGDLNLVGFLNAEWERMVPEIAVTAKRQVADPESTGSQSGLVPHRASEGGRF